MKLSTSITVLALVLVSNVVTLGQQSNKPIANFEVEVVTLDHQGFRPTRIVRRPGLFHLVVRDVTGKTAANFEIVDDKDERKASPVLDKGKAKAWNGQLTLNPGVHTLRLIGAPTVAMTITIDPSRR